MRENLLTLYAAAHRLRSLVVPPLPDEDQTQSATEHSHADPATLAKVRHLFELGAEAYRVLGDPELRVRYDLALARGVLRLPPETVANRPRARERGSRPLDELCRSAGAKLAAQEAAKLIDKGDLAAAKRELERALEYDGGANPALQERLEDLAVALYAMGG